MKKFPQIAVTETGKCIREYMEIQGLSVKDVQEYMGFAAPQAVYHWLNGRRLPTIDHLYALGELFHVPIDAILCGNRKYQPTFNVKLSKQLYLLRAYALMDQDDYKNQQCVTWTF